MNIGKLCPCSQRAPHPPEFAQARLSRSNGGHPQREGTNLGVCCSYMAGLARCEATKMSVCVCVCVWSVSFRPTRTGLCRFGRVWSSLNFYRNLRMYVCMYMYMYVYVYVCICICICIYAHMYTCMYIYIYMYCFFVVILRNWVYGQLGLPIPSTRTPRKKLKSDFPMTAVLMLQS